MTINYQLTAADYAEAFAHVQRSARRRRLLRRGMGPVGMFLPAALVLVSYWLLRGVVEGLESRERGGSVLAKMADVTLPWLSVGLVFVPVQIALMTQWRAPNWRQLIAGAMSLGMAVAMLFGAYGLLGAGSGPDAGAVVAPHLMWMALMAVGAVAAARTQWLSRKLGWMGQQQLHLPITMEGTVESLSIETANSRQEYAWRAIVAWAETPNLFLLHVGDLAFHMVPKRAFETEETRGAFRNMVGNLTAGPKGPAFPVLQGG